MVSELDQTKHRILLLTTTRSYRDAAFIAAAQDLGIEIVQAVNMPKQLLKSWPDGFGIDFGDLDDSKATITKFHQSMPLRAILSVDDSGSILAAVASEAIGLAHNSVHAARATQDKLVMRQLLDQSDVKSPAFSEYTTGTSLSNIISAVGFPCVVKPRSLNGSRGVIRADNREQLNAAIERTSKLIRSVQGLTASAAVSVLIESYIPGQEVALEGLLDEGSLHLLALFDKPDPLEGPFFEETIYLTPSRLPEYIQQAIASAVARAAAAIGLETGPVHAECRLYRDEPWIVEIAGRSIGGLCSHVLQFGAGCSLEEVILRQACAMDFQDLSRSKEARGVMMIPIPGAGLLRGVEGLEWAEKIQYVDKISITAPLNNPISPLPEGDGYLGFIFASGPSPFVVEKALRQAHQRLNFKIDPLLPVL